MKIIIADDDALICDSLSLIFSTEPDIEVIGFAVNGNEAIEKCRILNPDLVLMDIRMPECDGVNATKIIKSEYPNIRVVLLTTFTDEEYISGAVNAGAEGYLLKSTPASVIVERIRVINSGASVYDSRVSNHFLGVSATDKKNFTMLTERENEIMFYVAQGHSNKEIAAICYLGEGTVRNVISTILDKLNLRDRTQLAIYYWQN